MRRARAQVAAGQQSQACEPRAIPGTLGEVNGVELAFGEQQQHQAKREIAAPPAAPLP